MDKNRLSLMLLNVQQLHTEHLGPLDLTLAPQERLFIHGPSGAGKSLLLRVLADLDPHQGLITLAEQPQEKISPTEWRRQVGYLPAENRWWAATIGEHFPQVNEAWFEQLGLTLECLNWQVEHCSTGERQRLALLRLLQNQPKILLLDEATANLDPENGQRFEQLLLDYQQQQSAALIWISHDPSQIKRLATRTLYLSQGNWGVAP